MTTAELYAIMKDDRIDRRLIHGQLVERIYPFRCPAHAAVIANLSPLFMDWSKSTSGTAWEAYGYGCPYRIQANPDTLVYFDTSLVAKSVIASIPDDEWFVDGIPTLAIEVLDLNDSHDSVSELIEVAMLAGVPMFWMIDPFERTIDVYRPQAGRIRYHSYQDVDVGNLLPGFHCRVAEIFE